MKYSNLLALKKALIGNNVIDVEIHGGHGMVLTIMVAHPYNRGEHHKIDICTYDDGKKHNVDEFYVALNGEEL